MVNRRVPQPAHDDAARGVSRAEAKSIRVSDIYVFLYFSEDPSQVGPGAGVLLLGTHTHTHVGALGGYSGAHAPREGPALAASKLIRL